MLPKLATLIKSKTALAVLGVVLVGGSGGAVAMAATTGRLSTLGVNLNTSDQSTKTAEPSDGSDSHAHTTGVEGLLTACNTTATPNTISVTDKANKSWTFIVTSTTKFNGDTESASSSKGDNSANAGGASTGDHTGADTAHAAATIADVCAAANIGSRNVEVQATVDTTNSTQYDAWKVTLQGPANTHSDSATGDSTDHTSAGNNANGADGTPEAKPTKTSDGTPEPSSTPDH